jgi:hypothetical protein
MGKVSNLFLVSDVRMTNIWQKRGFITANSNRTLVRLLIEFDMQMTDKTKL